MYITNLRDGIENIINSEIQRLRVYYGVIRVDERDLARLRDIYQKASRVVGSGAIITKRDLREAENQVMREAREARPYGESKLATALSSTDTLIDDADYGRARDVLDMARSKLPEKIDTPELVKSWGMLSLHYIKLAEANQNQGRDERDNDLIQKLKDASQRAHSRATDLRLLRNLERLDERRELARTLSELAKRAQYVADDFRGRTLSYETNKSYPVRLNEITRQFQQMAIEQLANERSIDKIPRADLEQLVAARKQMAEYARLGANYMDWANEELGSVKTRLFTRAMRELSTAYSLVDELEKRFPGATRKYSLDRLSIQAAVATVHFAFGERTVALRLALEAVEDTKNQIEQHRDDLELKKIQAEIHEVVARVARVIAKDTFDDLNNMLEQTGLALDAEMVNKLQNLDEQVFTFARSKYFEMSKMYDVAREHYEHSVGIREEILSIEPDAFCACMVNTNVRRVAIIAYKQELFKMPKRAGLPNVGGYLAARIKRWRERAKEELNPDSTRFARWYLARSYALRDDLLRDDSSLSRIADSGSFGNSFTSSAGGLEDCEALRYECADKEFRKIKLPTNEMLADHALLLSDRAFNHLKSGVSAVVEAERTIEEAYEIWLRLPYSIWIALNTTDLNIPANFAHVKNIKSHIEANENARREDRRIAYDIYNKYRRSFLNRSNRATWDQLINKDMCILRRLPSYANLETPLQNNAQLTEYCENAEF